jgi:hypothetical protein
MYEALKKDNVKMGGLSSQMVDLSNDYDEMMRARDEAKRKLEEKFNDVYTKIKDNKDYTIREGKRVNEGLKQF